FGVPNRNEFEPKFARTGILVELRTMESGFDVCADAVPSAVPLLTKRAKPFDVRGAEAPAACNTVRFELVYCTRDDFGGGNVIAPAFTSAPLRKSPPSSTLQSCFD